MLPKHDEKLTEIRTLLITLGQDLNLAGEQALSGITTGDVSRFETIRTTLKASGTKGNEIDNEIVTSLALFGAEATDLRELVAYLKITTEFIRVSDNYKSLARRIAPLVESGSCFTSSQEYAGHLCKSAAKAVSLAIKTIEAVDEDDVQNLYRQVQVEESKTDDLYAILEKNVLTELSRVNEFSADHMQILSTMRKLERIADRAVNIAKLNMFAQVGGPLDVY